MRGPTSTIDAIAIASIAAVAALTAPSYGRSPAVDSNVAVGSTGAARSLGRALEGPHSFVPPGTLRFRLYRPQPTDMRSSDVIGLEVYNLSNERIGLVEDLIVGNDQIVKGVVINVEHFLGSNRTISVSSRSVLFLKRRARLDRALIDVTKETLRNSGLPNLPAATRGEKPVPSTPAGAAGKP